MAKRWTEGLSHFPVARRTPRVRLRAFRKELLVMASHYNSWNRNTHLCVDVKTFLHEDRTTLIGKNYHGVLTRDDEDHFRFEETTRASADGKRNPHVFVGRYITVTRRDDGSLRLNFKPVTMDPGFCVMNYALGVFREIVKSLKGLVEK